MAASRRLAVAVGALGALTCAGTLGYVLIEGIPWVDALYMTVITMSTVGFREVVPLSTAGKLFTIGLIAVGVGLALYLIHTLAEMVVEGGLRQFFERTAMQRKIESLENHVVVCGYGRFGSIVAEELVRNNVRIVVIEADDGKRAALERAGLPYRIGSAAEPEVLSEAGIERARAIVIATGSDPDNVFIALSARELNPSVRIHARVEAEAARRHLELAGAEQVVSAHQMGGRRMAAAILRPTVVDFLEIAHPAYGDEVDLEEIRVEKGSALEGQSMASVERQAPRVRIVALKRGDARIQLMPDEATLVAGGDHLVVIGDRGSLAKLAQVAGTAGAAQG
jgi:voltage-gated potassium channel